MAERIYLSLAHMSEAALEKKYMNEAVDTNWVAPLGPNVDAFEQQLIDLGSERAEEIYKTAYDRYESRSE